MTCSWPTFPPDCSALPVPASRHAAVATSGGVTTSSNGAEQQAGRGRGHMGLPPARAPWSAAVGLQARLLAAAHRIDQPAAKALLQAKPHAAAAAVDAISARQGGGGWGWVGRRCRQPVAPTSAALGHAACTTTHKRQARQAPLPVSSQMKPACDEAAPCCPPPPSSPRPPTACAAPPQPAPAGPPPRWRSVQPGRPPRSQRWTARRRRSLAASWWGHVRRGRFWCLGKWQWGLGARGGGHLVHPGGEWVGARAAGEGRRSGR